MTKEIFIFTKEDMVLMKEEALKILDLLPDDLKSALLIVAFLKEHIEKSTGVKIEKIVIK